MMTHRDRAHTEAITNLLELSASLLAEAGAATSHRAAHTVFGGRERIMRQTLVALAAGAELAEHDSPGEATLYVLDGIVTLRTAGGDSVEMRPGDHLEIPLERHGVHAETNAAFLLTAVPRENLDT